MRRLWLCLWLLAATIGLTVIQGVSAPRAHQGVVIRNSNDPDNPKPPGGATNPIAATRLPLGVTTVPNPAWAGAGVSGGIPARATICTTLSAGVTTAQINSAIAACPENQTVFLNAGTYSLGNTNGIQFGTKNNVTLRGAGADATKLVFTGRGSCTGAPSVICIASTWIGITGHGGDPQNLQNWTAGYAQGSTVLTFASTAGLAVGNTVILDQLDDSSDTGGIYVCGDALVCSYDGGHGNSRDPRGQWQLVKVTEINGTQVTIAQPIQMPNWRTGQDPEAMWVNDARTGDGVEDLSIDLTAAPDGGGNQGNIVLLNATDSWVKGVRSVQADRNHVWVYQSTRITVRDNYLWGSFNGISQSYGVELFGSTGILVENNITEHNTAPYIINGSDAGSVFGYNFSIDNFRADVTSLMSSTIHIHEVGTSYALVEGNQGLGLMFDDWHGTTHFMTLFRNHMFGDIYNNPAKTGQTQTITMAAFSRFFNIVGNVLGRTGYYTTYEPSGTIGCGSLYIYCIGDTVASGGPTDAGVKPNIMRWGNYDTVTATSRFEASEIPSGAAFFANAVPSSQVLPSSLYLSAKPDWFQAITWPPIGPDVTGGDITGYAGHAYKIPARVCYESLSDDPGYATTVRIFNASACY
jgi:hypothetical protein